MPRSVIWYFGQERTGDFRVFVCCVWTDFSRNSTKRASCSQVGVNGMLDDGESDDAVLAGARGVGIRD